MAFDLSELSVDPAVAPLMAIQQLDPSSVARTETLGKAFDFTDAVPVVSQIVDFFRLIPAEAAVLLPDAQRNQVTNWSNACWQTIQAMLQFDPNITPSPANERNGLIAQLKAQFADAMGALGGALAFITAARRTFGGAEAEARAVVEALKARGVEMESLERTTSDTVERILEQVRSVAAEAGVTHEGKHFGDQAAKHATAAKSWQKYTNSMAGGLVAFALLTWALGYWLSPPENAYQAAQLGISKLLIFSTLAFILFLCARTMMAHRHNEVVNRHRQNALLTFQTLAEAGGSEQTKDVVLTHAAACIYAPQESGFTKPGATAAPTPSLIEVLRAGTAATGH